MNFNRPDEDVKMDKDYWVKQATHLMAENVKQSNKIIGLEKKLEQKINCISQMQTLLKKDQKKDQEKC